MQCSHCESLSSRNVGDQIKNIHVFYHSHPLKQLELAKSIEDLVYLGGEDNRLHIVKQEFNDQLDKFNISIKAKGFFVLNRNFLSIVSGYTVQIYVIADIDSNFAIFDIFTVGVSWLHLRDNIYTV